MNARDAVEALVDAACPDREARRRIDLFEATVRADARVAAYREVADTAEDIANELFGAYDTEQGNGAMAVAARLRARAAAIETGDQP